MAHAIHGYEGACKNIHGHSYVLHVTVASTHLYKNNFIPKPGFIIDFKILKKLVNSTVVEVLDHQLVLSKEYLLNNPHNNNQANLVIWEMEPSAENILLYIQQALKNTMPEKIETIKLLLYETADSYAEWHLSAK